MKGVSVSGGYAGDWVQVLHVVGWWGNVQMSRSSKSALVEQVHNNVHVFVCACVYACVRVWFCVCVRVSVCVFMCARVNVYVLCECVSVRVWFSVCVCVCVRARVLCETKR